MQRYIRVERMRIISRKALREFWTTEKQSEIPLDNWYRTTLKADWKNLVELQNDFPSADLVGEHIIFDIGGNKYRLAVKIEFAKRTVFVKFVMTHKEYDKIYRSGKR